MKKTSRDVIILNLCNKKKHDHMMYAYSDMECLDRHNFLSFQPIFCFFARLLTSKIKIVKNHRDILPFYTCAPLIKIIWCTVPEIWSSAELFCHLGHFLPFYPSNTLKMKISKMKKFLEMSSFYASVPKIMIICYTVAEIWHMPDVTVIFILGYQEFLQALFHNW